MLNFFKLIFLGLLFIFIAFDSVKAQSTSIDSLKNIFERSKDINTGIELIGTFSPLNPDSAVYYLHQTEQQNLSEEQKINLERARGSLLSLTSKYDSAVKVFTALLILLEDKQGYESTEAAVLDNIGSLYLTLREPNQAIDFLNRSKKIREDNGLRSELPKSYYALGNVHLRLSQREKAIESYKKGIEAINGSKEQQVLEANINYMLGANYSGIKNDSALFYLTKAKVLYDSLGPPQSQVQVGTEIAKVMMYQGNYAQAIPVLEKNLIQIKPFKDWQQYFSAYTNLTKAYEGIGDYKKALAYQKLKYDTVVTFLTKQQTQSVAKITEDYRTDKQLDEAEETAFFATQRAKVYGSGAIVLIMVLIISYLLFTRAIQKKKLENLRAMIIGEENERKRVAKDLHDGIGVLLTSVKLRLTNFEDKVEDKSGFQNSLLQIDNACTEVRRISHNMVPASLTKLGLAESMLDLFDNVKASTKIEIQEKLSYSEGDFDESSEVLLYRILQELVNNTLKYSKANTIQVEMKKVKGEYHIDYKDNGIGFDKAKTKKGLGLKSIASRVDILKGKLSIESVEGAGAYFSITIPLQHE